MSDTPTAESTPDIVDDGVAASTFLLNLIATETSGLMLGEDGFYFQASAQCGADVLLRNIDTIVGNGFFINDFEYGQMLDFVIDGKAAPDGKLRVGGNLALAEATRFDAFEKSIICDDKEGYFEFFPGAPVPASRDEFLAALWISGIKLGIDTASLEATLVEGATKPGKYLVARAIPPTESVDARLAPRLSFQRKRTIKETDASGRADLHFYECGFPQVPEGPGPHILLEKIPAIHGRAGHSIGGKRIEPRPVKDFDIARMAGPGTRVTVTGANPTVVTDHGGYFIDVDPQQKISVTSHAKNSFPIGPKTGSFEVAGDRFEQCGAIEHQYLLVTRQVDVSSGAVRGKLVSRSGDVMIADQVENGGQVEAEVGNITVAKAVTGGRLVALSGRITVAHAEGSVLIAREVEITASATNCFIIADTIHIAKAAGISFYAQKVTLGLLDLADSGANPVTGFIALRNNLNARKLLRRFEKRQQRLDKVEQMETLVREQGLGEAWAALDARLSGGGRLSEDEARLFGPLLKPYEYVSRRRSMVARDREFFADPKNRQHYETAQQALESFDAQLRMTVGMAIQGVRYPAELTALMAGETNAEPADILKAAPQSFFAYVSSDPSIAELAKREKKLQNLFLGFLSRMLASTVMNEARIRPLHSPALLRAPCALDYDALIQLATAEDAATHADERRNDSARIEIPRDVVIPILVDGYSIGRLRNISDHGASVIFDDTQDNPPVFEKLEEVLMVIQTGHIVERQGGQNVNRPLSAWEEQRLPFAITSVIENDSAGLTKIGGYYAHMNEDAFNRARRLRTQIEALLMRIKAE